MQKMWVRWLVLAIFVAVLAAIFVRLGEWQLHRLEWRRETNARIVAHQSQPVKPFAEVFTGPITGNDQWQRVTVTGRYDPRHQLRVRYRSVNDTAGIEVVAPLVTADGRTVLIDRGFIAKPKNAPEAQLPPVPAGEVTVVGFVRRSEVGKSTATKPVEGNVRLINARMIGQSLGLKLEDGYLMQISATPAEVSALTPVPVPELTEGPHFSYAIQWFLFTVIGVGGAVLLVRSDLRDRRKRRERQARAAAAASSAAASSSAGDLSSTGASDLHAADDKPSGL